MNVHILATCLNRDLLAAALLVFQSLRAGFPSANIYVHGNDLDGVSSDAVAGESIRNHARFVWIKRVTHGQWIENLISDSSEPFWICDTDVQFKGKVEHWFRDAADETLFAGRYEPEFFERWTQSRHVARLHPSLMWFNARPLRATIRVWPSKHEFFDSVNKMLVQWHWLPTPEGLCFYDTCAGLHHAMGGKRFTDEQNASFTHRCCGTYSNLICKNTDELHDYAAFYDTLNAKG